MKHIRVLCVECGVHVPQGSGQLAVSTSQCVDRARRVTPAAQDRRNHHSLLDTDALPEHLDEAGHHTRTPRPVGSCRSALGFAEEHLPATMLRD
jgi:hypothetical protein